MTERVEYRHGVALEQTGSTFTWRFEPVPDHVLERRAAAEREVLRSLREDVVPDDAPEVNRAKGETNRRPVGCKGTDPRTGHACERNVTNIRKDVGGVCIFHASAAGAEYIPALNGGVVKLSRPGLVEQRNRQRRKRCATQMARD